MRTESPDNRFPGSRIVVIGSTCSGKTTLARHLADGLQIPHIELDALYWDPNWTEVPLENFRNRVAQHVAEPAWVVDGNYSRVRDLVWDQADTLIWLDYGLALILARLLKRTVRRIWFREILWSGNRETFRGAFFSRDSLLWWAVKTFGRRRREYTRLLALPCYARLQLVHLETPDATRRWLAQVIDTHIPD